MELIPGQVWWASPDAAVGREQSGRRPVLVVSSAAYLDAVTTLVLVVPITSVNRGWPNHVQVRGVAGLGRDSFAMSEQVRAISRQRLDREIGVVTLECLAEIRGWLFDFLTD